MEQRQSMPDIIVAAGSNLPNGENSPPEAINKARLSLTRRGWRTIRHSRNYRNPAWPPGTEAPDYVNAAFLLEGEGAPDELLADLHAVEAEAGRRRGARYLSRTLDLDLVAWGDLVLPDLSTVRGRIAATGAARDGVPDQLILPHPRMHERAFVLVPVAEIAPHWRHPVLGRTAAELRDALSEEDLASLTPV